MDPEEREDAASRIFARLFGLEARARDSGMTAAQRAEHARLTAEGIALFATRPRAVIDARGRRPGPAFGQPA